MPSTLVPDDFEVPESLQGDGFRLSMLTIHDTFKDYDAVMSSRENLTSVFGSHTEWPSEDLSIEQDMIDLGWHNKEFQTKTSFVYKVTSLYESKYYGCVYIYPPVKPENDVTIYMWVRKSEANTGLDGKLFSTVKDWISKEWPFKSVAYPGREIDWKTWESS